jgi:hypothetical protein
MAKDFNKDLDQTDGEQRRKVAQHEERGRETEPLGNSEAARKRTGDGFKGPHDEYAESGSRGAGYRETKGENHAEEKD